MVKEKKNVLFAPVGTSDPVRGGYDGPIIHICRHFKIDKIYLVFTDKMWESHLADDRYRNALKDLYNGIEGKFEGMGKEIEIVEPIHLNVDDASDYDVFAKYYRDILDRIERENEGDNIFANLTSGTQQMGISLCNEIIASSRDIVLIQVKSPEDGPNLPNDYKKIGNPEHPLLDDSGEYKEIKVTDNRCRIIDLHTLRVNTLEKRIKALIDIYEYESCLKIMEVEKYFKDKDIIELLTFGKEYSRGRIKQAYGSLSKTACASIVKYDDEMEKILNGYNYLLINNELGRISEFSLRLTSILYNAIFLLVGEKNVMQFSKKDKYGVYRIKSNEFNKLCPNYRKNTRESAPDSSGGGPYLAYKHLSDYYYENSSDVDKEKLFSECLLPLREVERKVRNNIAHDSFEISKEEYKDKSGITTDETIELIKNLIKIIPHANISEEKFNIYKLLNEKLYYAIAKYKNEVVYENLYGNL